MNGTEIFALLWVLTIAATDAYLALSNKETITRMMTRIGRRWWWVRLTYVAGLVFLYFHFWPPWK